LSISACGSTPVCQCADCEQYPQSSGHAPVLMLMSLHTCISSGVWFARWIDAAWKTSASSGWSWIARISSVRQSCRRPAS
jgi:hypothetical protein